MPPPLTSTVVEYAARRRNNPFSQSRRNNFVFERAERRTAHPLFSAPLALFTHIDSSQGPRPERTMIDRYRSEVWTPATFRPPRARAPASAPLEITAASIDACIFSAASSPRFVSRLASRRRSRTSETIALGVDDRSRGPLAKRAVRDRWRPRHRRRRRRRRRRASRDARAQ